MISAAYSIITIFNQVSLKKKKERKKTSVIINFDFLTGGFA